MTITIAPTVHFAAWPAERDRLGLIVQKRKVEYDPFGRMHVVLVLEPVTMCGEEVQIGNTSKRGTNG